MPERPGTAAARQLFAETSPRVWEQELDLYSTALDLIAKSKDKPQLKQLDALWQALPEVINQRSPPHLLLAEVSAVMEWKLIRGKFRPLQKVVDSNASSQVISLSTSAFKALQSDDWETAMKNLTQLRGIGPATASALLATVNPHNCPFMADEVIEVTTGKRDYTMKIYKELRTSLIQKSKRLGAHWSAEMVGRALWTRATRSALGRSDGEGLADDASPAAVATELDETVNSSEAIIASKSMTGHRKRVVETGVAVSAENNNIVAETSKPSKAARKK